MLTFCDGAEAQLLNALQSKESIFSSIIPCIKEPWYLEFNNSGFFSKVNL